MRRGTSLWWPGVRRLDFLLRPVGRVTTIGSSSCAKYRSYTQVVGLDEETEQLLRDSTARRKLLSQIYAPLQKLPRDSSEYVELARSAKVWLDYAQPFSFEKDKAYENANRQLLDDITHLQKKFSMSREAKFESLYLPMIQQSLDISGNELQLLDLRLMWARLSPAMSSYYDDKPPLAAVLLPSKPDRAVMEGRNQLIALSYMLEKLLPRGYKALTLDDVKNLHKITSRELPNDKIDVWGKVNNAGEFRTVVVQTLNYPMTIYPYPHEVPRAMEAYFNWKNAFMGSFDKGNPPVHPLLFAMRSYVAFLHIHPFYGGNGPVGRILLALAFESFGFPPVVFQEFNRRTYAHSLAYTFQKGDPDLFYNQMLITLHDMLLSTTLGPT